jgi:hypothetical protein
MQVQEIVPLLQIGHGVFNGALFVGFISQGVLGWRNRRRRLAGTPPDFTLVKKHRSRGPFLAALAPAGYLAGLLTAFLHRGMVVTAPAHLACGTLLVALVGAALLVSRKIRGPQSPWRTPHFLLGIAVVVVFAIQVFLGLDVLL